MPDAQPAKPMLEAPYAMDGPPPFRPDQLVTLANWQDAPHNRWSFRHVRELVPTARISRGEGPTWHLPLAERDLYSVRIRSGRRRLSLDRFLEETYTDGLLVLHRGRIVTERYFNGLTPSTPHLLMSVSKSVTAATAGALVGRGMLDPAWPVIDVVPELRRSSFTGATVQHLLDMRTGTRFDETYEKPDSDVRDTEYVYGWRPNDGTRVVPADALEYFATLDNDGPHGGPFRYRSILTDVLGWVIERAGGGRFHEIVSRELWQPMGAEFDADVTLDAHGNACADGGISATLRDAGRLGLLYLRRGRRGARAVLPPAWVDDTVHGAPDGADAFVGGDGAEGYPPGAHYRNCWWVIDPGAPMYCALGIHGQHVFVHPASQTVVTKLSTWPRPDDAELWELTARAATALADAVGGAHSN
jgi:CubicO group peptidase (beta-lactamase class C family)